MNTMQLLPRFTSTMPWRVYLLILLGALMTACSSQPKQSALQASNTEYCDNYLMYRMCAKDIDSNGEVDFMYFEDTQEIFMLSLEYQTANFEGHARHRCLQTMDEELRRASSRLLGLKPNSSSLNKTQVKTRLMLSYTRYLPDINHCMNQVAGSDSSQDNFGEEDYDDEWF